MKNIRASILFFLLCLLIYNPIYSDEPLYPMPTVMRIGDSGIGEENLSQYDILCHGGTGSLNLILVYDQGIDPFKGHHIGLPLDSTIYDTEFTYEWRDSSGSIIDSTLNLISVPTGDYTLTLFSVNNSGHNSSWTFTVSEPNALTIDLETNHLSGGYNISHNGGNDGWINSYVSGGTSSYYYSWSNGSNWENISALTAGEYTLIVTDLSGCSISSSVTLTEPPALVIDSISSLLHNGYNISCNGGHDGKINLSVSGGVPPYTFDWGNGVYTQNRDSISAGSYTVIVDDDIPGAQDTVQITLIEPNALSLNISSQTFPNGFNTSCYNCKDGSLIATPTGGKEPYSFSWNNGQSTSTIDSLSKGKDSVTVTDNNGCIASGFYEITSDIEGWKLGGNLNIEVDKQFIGTKDNKDVIFKTNDTTRMILTSDGIIEMNAPLRLKTTDCIPIPETSRAVYANPDGTLRIGGCGSDGIEIVAPPCSPTLIGEAWYNIPNVSSCNSLNPNDVFLRSDLRYVGIGTTAPSTKLDVVGGIRSSDLSGRNGINLVYTGNDGILKSLLPASGVPGQRVLYGDGSWSTLPVGSSVWSLNGIYIHNNPTNSNVGIGTSVPHDQLEVGNLFTFHGEGPTKWIGFNNNWTSGANQRIVPGFSSRISMSESGNIELLTAETGSTGVLINWHKGLAINNSGQVGINSDPDPTYGLKITGKVNVCNPLNGNNLNFYTSSQGAIIENNLGDIHIKSTGAINLDAVVKIAGLNNGLLKSESNGQVTNLPTNNLNQVLYSNGTWGDLPALAWSITSGSNIYSNSTGTIGIGFNPSSTDADFEDCSNYKLAVNGHVIATEIKVKLRSNGGWPDYVFSKNYNLKTLTQVADFIKKNNHLPGMPSKEEIAKNNGIELGEMNIKLLEKIEELTLYTINLQKEIEEMKLKIKKINKEIK